MTVRTPDVIARNPSTDGFSRETSHNLVRAIRASLTAQSTDAAALLEAYVALDALGAARWLLDSGAVRALIPPARLSAALATLIERLPVDLNDDGREIVEAVARTHADALPPDALAALWSRLPRDRERTWLRDEVERALTAAPGNAGVLRAAVALAIQAGDAPRAHALLTRLGRADSTLATTTYVRNTRKTLPPTGAPPARVALLSSYTIDPLIPFVDLECHALGLAPEIYLAPFNTWAREVIDEASGLRRFDPDLVFLSVAIDDLIPSLSRGHVPAEVLAEEGEGAVRRVVEVAARFRTWASTPLVVHSFHSAFGGPAGILDGREEPSRAAWLAELNVGLAEALRALPSCYLLDVSDLLLRGSAPSGDNPKLRHLASMRLPSAGLPVIARAYARYIAPCKGLTRKCVVLDLDNTLWGGVVGEDGLSGIRLGHTSPGSEFVEFQEFLRALSQRGILLAVNSKNNPDDALEVIRSHESMILRESAFSAVRINWRPKHDNMIEIAEELNIGVDSLVFVDDNPDERALMRQALPQVLTVELPHDASLYRSVLEDLPQLQVLAVTEEDRMRVGHLYANRQRQEVKIDAASLDDYLRSLAVAVECARATPAMFPRLAQLFQRTNQFNATTRRYDISDVSRLSQDPAFRLYGLKARDRFGDHGLVAAALVRITAPLWTIDSFVMSCRVIGYGIETSLLAEVCAEAIAAGATRLEGEFIATSKNVPAKDLYARHGFAWRETTGAVERWELDLAAAVRVPPWIAREPQ